MCKPLIILIVYELCMDLSLWAAYNLDHKSYFQVIFILKNLEIVKEKKMVSILGFKTLFDLQVSFRL